MSKIATNKTSANSSSISGTAPAFLYVTFGYNSSLNIIGYKRDFNNYMILQIGYSMDINTLTNSVETLLGLNKNNTSSNKN
jgi:hypothetical protein